MRYVRALVGPAFAFLVAAGIRGEPAAFCLAQGRKRTRLVTPRYSVEPHQAV